MNKDDSIKKSPCDARSAGPNLPPKPILKLDWCTYEAAKFACEKWHYSKTMPAGKTVKVGVWENDTFIGAIIFSLPNTPKAGAFLGLGTFAICELSRVALRKHVNPVSRIISVALKLLTERCPNLKAVVSYADPSFGHVGAIYQALGWVYVGQSSATLMYEFNGKKVYSRTANPNNRQFGRRCISHVASENGKKIFAQRKFKYMKDLTGGDLSESLRRLQKPYPKRAASETIDTSGVHPEKRGEAPTAALQS